MLLVPNGEHIKMADRDPTDVGNGGNFCDTSSVHFNTKFLIC